VTNTWNVCSPCATIEIMPFYALRVVCRSCGNATLIGGSAAHDLTLWRHDIVECRGCGTETPAANAPVVDLRVDSRERQWRLREHPPAQSRL